MEVKKFFFGMNIEILVFRWIDVGGFVLSVGICFLFVYLIVWIVSFG